jgi:hypothetical protein
MRMSLLTRTAAATAIAAASALAVTGTVAAAPNPAKPTKPTTSLSIRVSKGIVKRGQKIHVVGVLKGAMMTGLAGEFVNLDAAAPRGKFAVIGSSTTNKAGDVGFVVSQIGTERYRLVFKGTTKFAPARSAVVTVRVSYKMP